MDERTETVSNVQELADVIAKHEQSGSKENIRLAYSITHPTDGKLLVSDRLDLKPGHANLFKIAQSRIARVGMKIYPLELVYTNDATLKPVQKRTSGVPDDVKARVIEGRRNAAALRRAGGVLGYSRS